MILDIIVLVELVSATFKGFKNGIVMALFSFLSILIGLAAALKLSAVTAEYLKGSVNIGAKWLPIVAFALVFVAAVWLTKLGASLVEKSLNFAMLGWVNKIGGVIFYALLYSAVVSIAFFYLDKLGIFNEKMKNESVTYKYIKEFGPYIIDKLSFVLPFLKNTFNDLQNFFGNVATKVS